MSLGNWVSEKTRKLDCLDLSLTKISCFSFGVLLAILIPSLTEINVLWIVAVWLLLGARPIYRFFK